MPKYEFQVVAQAQFESEHSMPQQGIYRFSYTITVTNTGDTAAQLIARHWLITDANGQQQEVHGLGVIGRQPLLQPGESFQYSSGCELTTAHGHMQGRYVCITESAEIFEAPIERFELDAEQGDGPDISISSIPTPSSRTLH
ncbi:MAG: Co2+/Mg2+ efflux protein ApaG [Comamonas sp.]